MKYIVTDNASNMIKAFGAQFEAADDEDDEDEDDYEEDVNDIMEPEPEVVELLDAAMTSNSRHRLSCFIHSLMLVISAGLKEVRGAGNVVTRLKKLARKLHQSTVLKERYRLCFVVFANN